MLEDRIIAPETVGKTDLKGLTIVRGRFERSKVRDYLKQIFSSEEIAAMGAEGVDGRMMFGINPHYHALATGAGLRAADGTELLPPMPPSKAILALIMPRLNETIDLAGEADPSNQMRYTPSALDGKLLHKYDEIVLGYAAFACSAHCRYCYRLDLFNRSTGKGWIRPEELRDYIRTYNQQFAGADGRQSESGRRFPIREVLLSGGDPMVMSNAKLYCYLEAAGQAGVKMVRIGTKEIAFRPERFDAMFLKTLRLFHQRYPDVHINVVSHFTHPDEFLLRDMEGAYVEGEHRNKWLGPVEQAVRGLLSLGFVSIENQTPMIDRVNDDVGALHLLHQELRQAGIKSKYIFQCREIQGHRAFSVPLERAWQIHNEAMKGLSDTARSRFVMSAEHGKTEVIGMTDDFRDEHDIPKTNTSWSPLKRGLIFFKCHRSPSKEDLQGGLIIAVRNPEALWLSGYEDRLIYDCRSGGVNRLGILSDQWLANAMVEATQTESETRKNPPVDPDEPASPDLAA
ncbi:MAG: KamA family radical SAM protein [Geminicoccaceae bacterium]